MAVIDQDNFSNISWHSDQNIRVGSSASAGHEGNDEEGAGSKSQQGDAVDRVGPPPQLDPSHPGDEILESTVTDPHTENAGTKDAYVSYLITTHVSPRPVPRSVSVSVSLRLRLRLRLHQGLRQGSPSLIFNRWTAC